MSNAADDLIPRTEVAADDPSPAGWAAVVLDTATGLAHHVRVRIPGADNGQHAHGPCRWMPRGDQFPSEGDHALVVFDDDGELWITCWWPA